jgi:hypothetical protein
VKYVRTTSAINQQVMLAPQTVEECGLLHWLATRFGGKSVRLVFDTTDHDGSPLHPMLWIAADEEETP